jgi:hypothetical protein
MQSFGISFHLKFWNYSLFADDRISTKVNSSNDLINRSNDTEKDVL